MAFCWRCRRWLPPWAGGLLLWADLSQAHQNILIQKKKWYFTSRQYSMNRSHVAMMPYHKLFSMAANLPWNCCWSNKKCEALRYSRCDPQTWCVFPYWLLLSLAWCWYLSIHRLSTITANKKKLQKAYHDYDVGKCSLSPKIKTLIMMLASAPSVLK